MDDTGNLEKVYNDTKSWVFYNGNGESIGVYRRCQCGRFLTIGELLANGFDELKFTGWKCKQHGEVEPFFDRNFNDYE